LSIAGNDFSSVLIYSFDHLASQSYLHSTSKSIAGGRNKQEAQKQRTEVWPWIDIDIEYKKFGK